MTDEQWNQASKEFKQYSQKKEVNKGYHVIACLKTPLFGLQANEANFDWICSLDEQTVKVLILNNGWYLSLQQLRQFVDILLTYKKTCSSQQQYVAVFKGVPITFRFVFSKSDKLKNEILKSWLKTLQNYNDSQNKRLSKITSNFVVKYFNQLGITENDPLYKQALKIQTEICNTHSNNTSSKIVNGTSGGALGLDQGRLSISNTTISASELHNSTTTANEFEKNASQELQDSWDQLQSIKGFLDIRLEKHQVYIDHPNINREIISSVIDGDDLERYSNTPLKNPNNFLTQKQLSEKQLDSHVLLLSKMGKYKIAEQKYQDFIKINQKINDCKAKAKVDSNAMNLSAGHESGSIARAHIINFAAHELWKESIVCQLKFSIYISCLLEQNRPLNHLVSAKDSFSANRYSVITANYSVNRYSYLISAKLGLNCAVKSDELDLKFVHDTGASITSIPLSVLSGKQVDLSCAKITSVNTPNGTYQSFQLKINYLKLHEKVVFRDFNILVNPRATDCLLGLDITDRFLEEVRKTGRREFKVAHTL